MKRTLTTTEIANALLKDEFASWSIEAAYALAEYCQGIEEDTGEEMELDIVALRCEWDEYPDAVAVAKAFGLDSERVRSVEKYLNENTNFIKLKMGGYLVTAF